MRLTKLDRLFLRGAGVYQIFNSVNGNTYVGQSVDVYTRIQDHINALNKNSHNSAAMQTDWTAFGADVFNFRVLEWVGEGRLLYREAYYIGVLEPAYNFAGGNGIKKRVVSYKTTSPTPPSKTRSRSDGITGEAAAKIEDFLRARPTLYQGAISGEITIRDVAAVVGGSVATTGRVIKKLREA